MKKNTNIFIKIRGSLLLIIFYILLLPITFANAHQFHTSLTVMDYNSTEKSIEITIQLFEDDLVRVLEKKNNKRIELENNPESDKLILEYLIQNIQLKDADDKNLKINWVGKELDIDKVYVYLEIPFDGNFEGKEMQNSVFFETFPEQTNIVIFKFEKKKADLLFKVGDKFKLIQAGNYK